MEEGTITMKPGKKYLRTDQGCRDDGKGGGIQASVASALRESLIWDVLLVIALAVGCSGSTESQYKDGRVYFINNARPPEPGDANYVFNMRVVYEEHEYFIPSNIDHDGNPTGAGSIDLTEGRSPLPGGTVVHLECHYYAYNASQKATSVDLTVDGNVTVEAYSSSWDRVDVIALLRIIAGKWDGVHRY